MKKYENPQNFIKNEVRSTNKMKLSQLYLYIIYMVILYLHEYRIMEILF